MTYEDFLSKKSVEDTPSGFDIEETELNDKMFPFQRAIVKWALKRGRAAIFANTGLGKSLMALEWANQVCKFTNGNVLILTPLAVAEQFIREGEKFGIKANHAREQSDIKPGINVINYEMLHKIDCRNFQGVCLDECFVKGTLIDCFDGDKLIQKPIEQLKIGDEILNAYGKDTIKETYKRKIDRIIEISIGGKTIRCSENHPFFTLHGWRPAKYLQSGDYIMETTSAMRLVRGHFHSELLQPHDAKVLRNVLLSEMANESKRNIGESSYEGNSCENWSENFSLVEKRIGNCKKQHGEDQESKPNEKPRNERESFAVIEEYEAQTFRAWGEWSEDDITAAKNEGCIVERLDCGVCYITGKTSTRFSNLLQSRFGESVIKNSNRNKWIISQDGNWKNSRPEEEKQAGVARVDSVIVLESGDSRLDKYRDESGKLYLYDIKASQHPSFSVEGLMVHNSSILKNFDGKYRTTIIDTFSRTPYRLAATATPAPNDYMELGNHSQFLGILSYHEMLSTFFVHDSGETQKWRLKGHAENEFWKWMCGWAVNIRKPSNLGFSDDGYNLPPINYHYDIIETFDDKSEKLTLSTARKIRKSTIQEKVDKTLEIVAKYPNEPILIWCGLNEESKILMSKLSHFGAVEIKGSDKTEKKEWVARWFAGLEPMINSKFDPQNPNRKILISKPSIFGFGLNFQACSKQIFCGVDYSFESEYQAIRRSWRFGQTKPVEVHFVLTSGEESIIENVKEKERKFEQMFSNMIEHMKEMSKKEIYNATKFTAQYNNVVEMQLPKFLAA